MRPRSGLCLQNTVISVLEPRGIADYCRPEAEAWPLCVAFGLVCLRSRATYAFPFWSPDIGGPETTHIYTHLGTQGTDPCYYMIEVQHGLAEIFL